MEASRERACSRSRMERREARRHRPTAPDPRGARSVAPHDPAPRPCGLSTRSRSRRSVGFDEPEGQGLVIRRHGRELPEVVYFVVPRWRKPLAWLRTTAAWFADRLRYGSIGRLVGSSLFRRARRPVAAFRDALRVVRSRPVQVRPRCADLPVRIPARHSWSRSDSTGRLIVPTLPRLPSARRSSAAGAPRSGANARPSGCARARRPARHSPWPRHRHARGSAGSRLSMDIAAKRSGGRWMAGWSRTSGLQAARNRA